MDSAMSLGHRQGLLLDALDFLIRVDVVREPTVTGSLAASLHLGREHRSLNDLDLVSEVFELTGRPSLRFHNDRGEVMGRLVSAGTLPRYDHVRLLEVEIKNCGSTSKVLVDVDTQSVAHPSEVLSLAPAFLIARAEWLIADKLDLVGRRIAKGGLVFLSPEHVFDLIVLCLGLRTRRRKLATAVAGVQTWTSPTQLSRLLNPLPSPWKAGWRKFRQRNPDLPEQLEVAIFQAWHVLDDAKSS